MTVYDGSGTPLRLLPWTTPDGRPCYLSSDSTSGGRVARMADEVEADLLDSASDVLDLASPLLHQQPVTVRELRFAGLRLAEALQDTLRIARSRGVRLAIEQE